MRKNGSILRYLGLAAGIILLVSLKSCMIELDSGHNFEASLSLQPSVSGSALTKATVADDAGQRENALCTLDVFIKGITVPDFWKTYHLTTTQNNLREAVDNLLSRNWREEVDDSGTRHFVEGDKYDVYAVANSPLTMGTVASFNDLKNLRANEYSSACVWDDGSINPAVLNLHKTYLAGFDPNAAGVTSQNKRAFTNTKQFVMDGVVRNWSPEGGIQVIPMTLERAASKFEVNVSFADAFLQSLAREGKTIVGQPGWRFVNFAYDAPLINPASYGGTVTDADHVLTAGAMILGNSSYATAAENYRFTINTYSYPRVWDLADAVNEAPALVVSVGFKDANDVTKYTYYRIPLVDQKTTHTIGRNMFYRVNATIESAGSTSLDDLTGVVVEYDVIPWNDPQHSSTQPAPVEFNERLYLQVTPHTYTLRGDGVQTVDLSYKLPTGKHIKIQYFTTQANNEAIAAGNAVGNSGTDAFSSTYTDASNYSNNPAAFYYNKSGTYRTTFVNKNVQAHIADNNADGVIDHGTITVLSNSLANKAIKHIAFRVYLDVTDWYAKGLYRDIYIRHFPTDNIQGIAGSWSSRWSGSSNITSETQYSYNPAADGWGDPSNFSYVDNVECTEAEYNRALEAYRSTSTTTGTRTATREEFLTNVTTNTDRANANSQTNAVNGYWGRNPSYVSYTSSNYSEPNLATTSDNWDYWSYYYNGRYDGDYNKYKYSTYYTNAAVTHYYARRYTRTVQVEVPSTGNWVDWDNDKVGSNGATRSRTVSDDNFKSKVYMPFNAGSYQYGYNTYRWDAGSYCVPIAQSSSSGGRYYYTYNNPISSAGSYTNLVNNYMYVIQISETNPTYKLGRPELDGNYQTNDHVVSPAFMIASQLGAVSPFGSDAAAGRNAAAHCGTYMEVAQDGKRYVGWRLPTEEEIRVIIKYQGTDASSVVIDGISITDNNDRVLTPVLTGSYYWTSNNKTAPVETGYTVNPSSDAYVRCVRDMSPEEIKALNRE